MWTKSGVFPGKRQSIGRVDDEALAGGIYVQAKYEQSGPAAKEMFHEVRGCLADANCSGERFLLGGCSRVRIQPTERTWTQYALSRWHAQDPACPDAVANRDREEIIHAFHVELIGPCEVIVFHALNFQPQVVQVDGRVVDCCIVIVVRLAGDAAIAGEATAGQSSNPRKARMRADESGRFELI